MNRKLCSKLYIGTSGYSYDHWRGVFYPDELPQSKWLEHYSKYFSTVELNNTFYRLPQEAAFRSWEARVGDKFVYSVKASRFITHIKKLHECKQPLNLFLSRAKLLKKKLGPVLLQLPPRWKCNVERLESFVKLLPKNIASVFEFRDPTWFNEEVYEILRKNKLTFCIYDMSGVKCPEIITSNVIYIRFHGSAVLYGGSYSDRILKNWANKIKQYLRKKKTVYVYFNNDAYGFAVKNALRLKELLFKI